MLTNYFQPYNARINYKYQDAYAASIVQFLNTLHAHTDTNNSTHKRKQCHLTSVRQYRHERKEKKDCLLSGKSKRENIQNQKRSWRELFKAQCHCSTTEFRGRGGERHGDDGTQSQKHHLHLLHTACIISPAVLATSRFRSCFTAHPQQMIKIKADP